MLSLKKSQHSLSKDLWVKGMSYASILDTLYPQTNKIFEIIIKKL